jgi:diguanylate cyclase (GGDEF)-like protein/PAS domain S-box-containing protein
VATILIVDDRPSNRQFLTTLLGYGGHRLLEAGEGAAALALVRSDRPDLIITDILMPTMDGYEFVQHVRADPDVAPTPVIFYTATYSAPQAEKLAKTCGVYKVLSKPCEPEEILAAVNQALGVGGPVGVAPPVVKGRAKASTSQTADNTMSLYIKDLEDVRRGFEDLASRGAKPGAKRDLVNDLSKKFADNVASMQRVTTRLSALHEVAMEMMTERDPARLVQLFFAAACDLVDSNYAAIGMRDETEQAIQLAFAKRVDVAILRGEAGRTGLLATLLSGRPVLRMRSADGTPSADGLPDGHPPVRDLLGIPVAAADRVYGWMYFADGRGETGFSDEDVRVANAMARQLAVLYENAMLYDAIQRHAAKLQVEAAGRKRAQEALAEREAGLRRAQLMAKLAHVVTRPDGSFESWSETLPQLVGLVAARMPQSTREWLELLHPEDRALFRDKSIEAGAKGARTEVEYRLRHQDGGWIDVRQVMEPIEGQAGGDAKMRWFNTLQDMTERKQAEEKIKRLNRVYAVLSGINGLIVRVRDRDELFREACRLAVEAGKFRMAWIGLVDREAMLVKPVAWHGPDAEYIHLMPLGLVDTEPQGRGLAGRAVRERTAITVDDMTQDPRVLLRKEALERGFRSLVMLPLLIAEESVGVLALYAGEVGFFDEEEMKLLRELAGDIAFALEHMQKEERLRRLTRVNAMLSGINGVIARVRDRRELFQEACRIAVDTGGLRFAWLSIVDEKEMTLKPVASAGTDEGFLKMIEDGLSLRDDAPEGHGIGAVAVRERRALVVNDTQSDPRIRHKKGLDERGVRSAAVLPLIVAGRAVGSFGLHSGEAGFFVEEEMKVLNELAGNIAFALDHIEKEEKVERLTRVYAVLSGINAAIVRIRDRQELFQEACRIAIEHGKFRMAWVGLVDRAVGLVKPVASAGEVGDFFESAPLAVIENKPGGHGLSGRAVRDMKPMISNDVKNDPQRLMRKELDARGINSLVVIPLIVSGESVGVLSLYAADVGFFDEEEMRLLLELAGDISFALEHIGKAEKLDYLAYYDELTGLANRTLFLERVAQKLIAAGSAKKVAVFTLDVERFRGVNDALGRQAGDELLKQVADRLRKAGGDESRLARIGADHFAVVSTEAQNEEQLARLTELRLKECFGSPFRIGDGEITTSAKVGIAVFPNDGADAGTLLRNAEAAVEKAKSGGERYLFYAQEMTERIAEKLSLEGKLRQALEKEEFVLHYQPKVDLETRSIVGVEALIRWQSPERGLVPPMKFIPLLEETGLILQVGSWAIKRASLDHRSWSEQKLKPPRVAVNVSPIQLRQRNFVEVIEQAIVEGLAPTGIDLEITESLIMEDIQANIQKLNSARGLGINIAIDDFGTGYSSLAYLARLPVQSLKIDRSFIEAMNKDPNAMTLVSTIISLAHSLRLKVVAEGVETEEQANSLRLLRCDEMQGYLFSKPLPMAGLVELLRKIPKA